MIFPHVRLQIYVNHEVFWCELFVGIHLCFFYLVLALDGTMCTIYFFVMVFYYNWILIEEEKNSTNLNGKRTCYIQTRFNVLFLLFFLVQRCYQLNTNMNYDVYVINKFNENMFAGRQLFRKYFNKATEKRNKWTKVQLNLKL